MRYSVLFFALTVLISPTDITSASDSLHVKLELLVRTANSTLSHTVIGSLYVGSEELYGSEFPKIKVLVMPLEGEQIPLQFSVVAENGQVLNSTIVYFSPEFGAEFSLAAEGFDAHGSISSTSKANPE